MRVISGKFGGRKLKPVPGNKTRPTTDKVREALFNMIGPYFNGGNFLDLYAGSGAVSLEAVSRGMDHAILVDKQYAAYKTIQENIAMVSDPNDFSVWKMNAESALTKLKKEGQSFDYIFLDPPYKKQQMMKQLDEIAKDHLLNNNGMVICETDNQTNMSDDAANYRLIKQKDYGLTIISIYQIMN